jgi:hypothetical protein
MKRRRNAEPRFAVCIDNRGYRASLEVGKLYRLVPDAEAAAHGYLRVIDESGEDYGYAASRFMPIEVPRAVDRALSGAVRRSVPGRPRAGMRRASGLPRRLTSSRQPLLARRGLRG